MQMSFAGGAPLHSASPFFIKRCSDKDINVDKRKTITTTDEDDMMNYDTPKCEMRTAENCMDDCHYLLVSRNSYTCSFDLPQTEHTVVHIIALSSTNM
jgi:hypothetical protein